MDSKYKNIFDTNFQQTNQSPEVCGIEICSIPLNLLRYFYYQCLDVK